MGDRPASGLDRAVEALACAFTFSLPWAKLFVLPIFGTGPRVIGILLSGAWLISVLVHDKLRPLTNHHHVAYLFMAWAGVSIFWSPDRLQSLDVTFQYVQLFLLAVIVWNVFSSARRLLLLKQAYVLGCWVTAGILAYNFLIGEVTEWERRATVANSNSNEIGLLLSLALPMAWHLATSSDPDVRQQVGRLRLLNFCYIGAGLVGIMLTASRGAFISIVPFVLLLFASMRGQSAQRRVVSGMLTSILVVVASLFVPESAWERISTIPRSIEERDFGARYEIWTELSGFIFASVPSFLFGNGVGSADILVKDAHNLAMSILFGVGIVGLALFATFFGGVIWSAFLLPPADKAMWLAVLATFLIGSISFNSDAHKVTWLICAMVLAERGAHGVFGRRADAANRSLTESVDHRIVIDDSPSVWDKDLV